MKTPLPHAAARRFDEQRGRVLRLWRERAPSSRGDGALGQVLDGVSRALEGRAAEQVERPALGATPLEALHGLDLLQRIVLEVLEETEPISFGERAAVLDTFHSLRIAVAEDYQARERHLTQAMVRSEERYLAAVRAAGFAIWDWDLKEERIHWSHNVESLLGHPLDALSSLGAWLEYVHPNDRTRVGEGLRRAIEVGKPGWSDTFGYLKRDGTYAGVLGRGWILYDDGGEPTRVVGGLVDVTEQQALEQKLAEQVKLTRTIVENAASGLFLLDEKGAPTYVNAAGTKLTGYTLAELKGKALHDLLHPKYEDGSPFPIDQCPLHCGNSALRDHECPFMRKDGSWFVASCSVTPIDGGDGTAVLEFRDVTELKRSQERLRQAVQARDEFLSIASHELRTPLTALRMQLQGLTRGPLLALLDEKVKPRLDGAERSVERMVELVNELMDVARLRASRIDLQLEEIDLHALVDDVVARLQPDVKRAGSELTVEMPESVRGRWDKSRVDQVLTNLLTNALKYGGGKPISVQVEDTATEVRLSVQDHGIGIAPTEHGRIFERFERAVSARHYGGFGLGLWIVRQVLDAMGGQIHVESELGQGSRFVVTLPRAEKLP